MNQNNEDAILLGGKSLDNIDKDALISEFNQAWEQHRHLDNIRTKYLAFGFSVALGGVALLGAIIENINNGEVGAIILGFVVSIFALAINDFIKALVNDMANIFPHYENVWKTIRLELLDESTENLLNVRTSVGVAERKSTVGTEFSKIANMFQYVYYLFICFLGVKLVFVVL